MYVMTVNVSQPTKLLSIQWKHFYNSLHSVVLIYSHHNVPPIFQWLIELNFTKLKRILSRTMRIYYTDQAQIIDGRIKLEPNYTYRANISLSEWNLYL